MDNNQNFKRRHKGQASVDGFVSGGRKLGGVVRKDSRGPKHGQATPSLDSLIHRNDGFYPAGRSIQKTNQTAEFKETKRLLDDPIIIDDDFEDNKKKKKHYFGRKHPKLHRVVKRTTLALLVLVIAGSAFFGYKLYTTKNRILAGGGQAPAVCDPNVDPSELKTEGDSRVNVLLLGIGGEGHDGPNLTDTIIVASIDPLNHKVDLLSVPRDLWVQIPNDGTHKINQAYADAKEYSISKKESQKQKDGIKAIDETLQSVLGIPIHYHVVVSFSAFKDVVNAVGGVKIDIPEDLYDPTMAWENENNPYLARKGVHKLGGRQALMYARSRETSSDFARGERQRALLVGVKDKVMSVGTFSDPIKVSKLLDSLGKNVFTDFDTGSMKCLYQQISQVQSSNIKSLDMVTPPNDIVTTGNMGGISIVQPKEGLFVYDAIQKYARSSLKDGFILKENAKIAIYNATNSEGLATGTKALLKSYGYNVVEVGNTPTATNPIQTTVVDLKNNTHKYTKHYLEGRFKTTASSNMPANLGLTPPVDADFVIILGEDAANTPQN